MKLSALKEEELSTLTNDQISEIVFGTLPDADPMGDVALVLGTKPSFLSERAKAAAELYLAGKVRYIVPSGGVTWPEGGNKTEAEMMREVLLSCGVPDEAIIPDNLATSTKENILCGLVALLRGVDFSTIKRVVLVTSRRHMRRALAIAKYFLPPAISVQVHAVTGPDGDAAHWHENADAAPFVRSEARLLRKMITDGMMDEIIF